MNLFLTHLGLFFCLTLFVHVTSLFFIYRLLKKISIHPHPWVHQFFQTVKLPFVFLIWILYLTFVLHTFAIHPLYHESLNGISVETLRPLGTLLCFLWFGFSYIHQMENTFKNRISHQEKYDPILVHGLAKIAQLVIGLLGLLTLLGIFGISVQSLLALGGIGAAGIALAAKGVIGNVLGGLLLYISQPFCIGEKIRSPDRQIEGIVEEIGWTTTCVRDADGHPLYIPNGLFTEIILINLSRVQNLGNKKS